jgi:hypothetical protein
MTESAIQIKNEPLVRKKIEPKPLAATDADLSLKDLLRLHHENLGENSLPVNIGDGFLYKFNPVFKNIRDAFLQRQYIYSDSNIEGYLSYPLLSLEEILSKRIVPYFNNLKWLEVMLEKAPDRFFLRHLYTTSLKGNYLMHESAHCLADFELNKTGDSGPRLSREHLVEILMGEAFANSCEVLSHPFMWSASGRFFLKMNIYFQIDRAATASLVYLFKKLGFHRTIRLVFGSFLYANALFLKLGPVEIENLKSFAGIAGNEWDSPEIQARWRILENAVMGLSENFRLQSTRDHLYLLGFGGEISELLDFDPLEVALKNSRIQNAVTGILKIMEQGFERELLWSRDS